MTPRQPLGVVGQELLGTCSPSCSLCPPCCGAGAGVRARAGDFNTPVFSKFHGNFRPEEPADMSSPRPCKWTRMRESRGPEATSGD